MTRPTLALLGEGGEPEYVIPQSKMRGFGGGGISFGDINIQGDRDPVATANRAAEAVRSKILTSGAMRGAVVRTANGSRFR